MNGNTIDMPMLAQKLRNWNSSVSVPMLPAISLGLWHNFGDVNPLANSMAMAHYAFDQGITHFDLANNYGPSYGSAEETFGQIMKKSFMPYRDELFISTKAGYDMWPGPYGNWGSRKYLMSSLDQSLRRMHLDYVDVFYSHRYDPETPLEETLQTLVDIVRQGKALYVGLSKYPKDKAEVAYQYLKIPVSSHVAATGGQNISIVDDDATLGMSNPALLSNVSDGMLSFDYTRYMAGANLIGAQYVKAFGQRHTGSVALHYLGYGSQMDTDDQGKDSAPAPGFLEQKQIQCAASAAEDQPRRPRWRDSAAEPVENRKNQRKYQRKITGIDIADCEIA